MYNTPLDTIKCENIYLFCSKLLPLLPYFMESVNFRRGDSKLFFFLVVSIFTLWIGEWLVLFHVDYDNENKYVLLLFLHCFHPIGIKCILVLILYNDIIYYFQEVFTRTLQDAQDDGFLLYYCTLLYSMSRILNRFNAYWFVIDISLVYFLSIII
jgi:hypothetical protein